MEEEVRIFQELACYHDLGQALSHEVKDGVTPWLARNPSGGIARGSN